MIISLGADDTLPRKRISRRVTDSARRVCALRRRNATNHVLVVVNLDEGFERQIYLWFVALNRFPLARARNHAVAVMHARNVLTSSPWALLSQLERDLLIKVKVDGFVAKEVLDRHTVLSPKAVHVRIQRTMKRLQEAAWEFPSQNGNPTTPVKSGKPEKTKIFQKV